MSNDPVFHTDVGEAHRDQCLATFAALNLPLSTPIHLKARSCAISDLLAEAVANFDLHEKEPAWTAMAFAKYLPPKKEWVNRFRERTTFSQMAHLLLNLDPNTQSCAGTHIFQALAKIDQADRRYSILDNETRKQLDAYLTATLRQVAQRQQADGSWNKRWRDSINADETGPTMPLEFRILVTGHLLELLNSLDAQRRLLNAVYARAAEWLQQTLNSKEIRSDSSLLCPFTHAARAAREILVSSRTNRTSVAILSTSRSSGVGLGETHQGDKQNNKNNKL